MVQDLRETRALVNSISTSNITYGEQGVFYISANLATEQLETVETEVLAHIQRLHDELVSEAELSRVRTQVANRYVFGNETSSDRASMYGYYHALTGDIENALNYPTAIRTVDAEMIQSAVRRYLPITAYGALRLHPEAN